MANMKRFTPRVSAVLSLLLFTFVLVLVPTTAHAQFFGPARSVANGTTNPPVCSAAGPANIFLNRNATPVLRICVSANTWADVAMASSSAPTNATYITQTANATLTNEQALSTLATGYMKVTTTTGVVSSQAVPIPVADGGTGATTLTANNVILGNGTSPVQFVAPGAIGNVLTSDGSTWNSSAAAGAAPGGSGSELQIRAGASTFGAVTGSSSANGGFALVNQSAAATPFDVKAAASQSAPIGIFRQNTSSTMLLTFDKVGNLVSGPSVRLCGVRTAGSFTTGNASDDASGCLSWTNTRELTMTNSDGTTTGTHTFLATTHRGTNTAGGAFYITDAGGEFWFPNVGLKQVAASTKTMKLTDTGAGQGWLQPASCYVASDQTNATTTMASTTCTISGLVTAKKYQFTCSLFMSDSLAADGAKIDFAGGTATETNFRAQVTAFDSALNLSQQNDDLTDVASAATFTGNGSFEVHGSFEPSGAGTFLPQFAQAAHTTGTLTLYRGSNCVMWELP